VETQTPSASSGGAYVYIIAAVAALSGFLFGYDTAVVNGAILFLRWQFQLSDVQTEIAAGSLLLGCVFGALAGGPLSDHSGRKRPLSASAVLFFASAIGAALSRNLPEFVVARFAGGLAIGVASAMAPVYIAELSPARIRGRLVTMNQLAIVVGILAAFFVNWTLASLGPTSWRWMFAVAALPSLIFWAALWAVPESPRWLLEKGRHGEAFRILERITSTSDAGRQLEQLRGEIADEQHGSAARLLQPPLRRPMVIATLLAVFSQVTGINTILYYGSLIFSELVHSHSTAVALLANVIIGAVNLAGTVAALLLIDRLGRRALLMFATGGMGLSLLALGFVFRLQPAPATPILLLILIYVACFAAGLGPGSWLVMSELFPTNLRGRAMSAATLALWLACLLVTATFLTLVSTLGAPGAMWTYAALCSAAFAFVLTMVPETTGRTLEQIQSEWSRTRPSRRQPE